MSFITQIQDLDEILTYPIQTLKVPFLDEMLFVPGCCFGLFSVICTSNVIIIPTLMEETQHRTFFIIFSTLHVLVFSFALFGFILGKIDIFSSKRKSNVLQSDIRWLPVMFVYAIVINFVCSPTTSSLVWTYICTMGLSLAIVVTMKNWSKRKRPMVKLKQDYGMFKKWNVPSTHFAPVYVDYIQAHSERGSFPSGDAMCATIFSATLVSGTNNHIYWIFAFLSALGRMYFWCHHLFDCIVGMLLGYAVFVMFYMLNCNWSHAIVVWIFVVIYMRTQKKRKRKKKKEQNQNATLRKRRVVTKEKESSI